MSVFSLVILCENVVCGAEALDPRRGGRRIAFTMIGKNEFCVESLYNPRPCSLVSQGVNLSGEGFAPTPGPRGPSCAERLFPTPGARGYVALLSGEALPHAKGTTGRCRGWAIVVFLLWLGLFLISCCC